jgi:hypothetical protein
MLSSSYSVTLFLRIGVVHLVAHVHTLNWRLLSIMVVLEVLPIVDVGAER